MFSNKVRMLTDYQLSRVNPLLNKKFGSANQIASGSVENYDEGITRFHISLIDANTYKADGLMKEIGRVIKDVLGADEVYHMGKQIA